MQNVASQSNPDAKVILTFTGVTKQFGGTQALRNVDFDVRSGEAHALLGANGAGKSTLIKILAGIHAQDKGEILLGGEALTEAMLGTRISFVHQDLGLIDSMSVGENMAMAYGYPRKGRLIDWASVNARASKALAQLGTPLPSERKVADLSQAEKAIVAIARAVARNVDVLVLDEPTASLPDADVERLFAAVRALKAQNVGVIYVSHRLDEIFKIADAVTVLRDGQVVATYRPLTVTPDQLVLDICGKAPIKRHSAGRRSQSPVAMRVTNLEVEGAGPVTFEVMAGEILGLAGLRGQGQEAVGRAIGGLRRAGAGTIEVGGRVQSIAAPSQAIAAGIGFASSKRAEEGLAANLTVRENLYLNPTNFGRKALQFLGAPAESRQAAQVLNRLDVRPKDPEKDVITLSGGNQQKVVLARLVGQSYKVLLLEDPTIGVDVGAKAEIYNTLAKGAADGAACIVVSTDLEELVQICDRVLAFGSGRIVEEIDRENLTMEVLISAISGADRQTELMTLPS